MKLKNIYRYPKTVREAIEGKRQTEASLQMTHNSSGVVGT